MRNSFVLAIFILVLPAGAAEPPQIAGCAVFPADNVWNVPIDTLPVDRNSAAYVATVGAGVVLHPDFGPGNSGIPYVMVGGGQAKTAVTFSYKGESDAGPYPIPADPPIEGGPNSKGDRHILMLDRDNCMLYELFAAYPPQGDKGWTAGRLDLHRRRRAADPAGTGPL